MCTVDRLLHKKTEWWNKTKMCFNKVLVYKHADLQLCFLSPKKIVFYFIRILYQLQLKVGKDLAWFILVSLFYITKTCQTFYQKGVDFVYPRCSVFQKYSPPLIICPVFLHYNLKLKLIFLAICTIGFTQHAYDFECTFLFIVKQTTVQTNKQKSILIPG